MVVPLCEGGFRGEGFYRYRCTRSSKTPDTLQHHTHAKLGKSRELRKPNQAQRPIPVLASKHLSYGVQQSSNVKPTLHSRSNYPPTKLWKQPQEWHAAFSQLSGSSRSLMARSYDVQQKADRSKWGHDMDDEALERNAGLIAAIPCTSFCALATVRQRLGKGDCDGHLKSRPP
jgi:hypothetical protein